MKLLVLVLAFVFAPSVAADAQLAAATRTDEHQPA
jgi:hypothetical protein